MKKTVELAKCVGCGCDDNHACHVSKSDNHWEGPCYWVEVDYKKGIGVCSNPSCNIPEIQKKFEKACLGIS